MFCDALPLRQAPLQQVLGGAQQIVQQLVSTAIPTIGTHGC